MVFKKATLIVLFLLLASSAYGWRTPEMFDDYRFKIAVYGPCDEIFIWWGHAALIVEDTRWNFSRVFDWGIFSYPSDSFINDFLKGQVQYSVVSGRLNFEEYLEKDRDIMIYTLDLDREAKEIILAYAEDKVMIENRYYDYHEFRDNCSTGVRDILDLGLRGQLKAATDSSPGRFTVREHVRRYTWFRPLSEWMLDFVMGQSLDRMTTVWEEMFLPVEIGRNIVDFIYTDEHGKKRNLVTFIEVLNFSKSRQPILNAPITVWPFFLTAGLIIAGLILAIDALRKKYPYAHRILYGSIQCLFGLVLGALGCVLVLTVFFMGDDYFLENINIFFVNPFLLFAFPLGILFIINKPLAINPERCLRFIWTFVFIIWALTFIYGGVTAALVKIAPSFSPQQNQSVYGLILPAVLALSNIPKYIGRYFHRRKNDPQFSSITSRRD